MSTLFEYAPVIAQVFRELAALDGSSPDRAAEVLERIRQFLDADTIADVIEVAERTAASPK